MLAEYLRCKPPTVLKHGAAEDDLSELTVADEPSALYTLNGGSGPRPRHVNQNGVPSSGGPAAVLAPNGVPKGDAPKNDAETRAPLRCAPQWHHERTVHPRSTERGVIRGVRHAKGTIASLNASSEVALLSENKKKKNCWGPMLMYCAGCAPAVGAQTAGQTFAIVRRPHAVLALLEGRRGSSAVLRLRLSI